MFTIYEASTKEKSSALSILASNEKGLSHDEAAKRLEIYGKNVFFEDKKTYAIVEFLKQFKEPLVLILLCAAFVSFLGAEYVDGIIILVIVLTSSTLNFFQEYQANTAAAALKSTLTNKALVLREGKEMSIIFDEVVPGDIVRLRAGALIPGDSRLLSIKDFFVNESSLTGESLPTEKTTEMISGNDHSLSDLHNCVFSGTNVESGEALAVVCSTGKNTEFGKIAKDLESRPQISEFSRGIHEFGFMIMRLTVILVLFIFLFNAIVKHDLLGGFLFAIAVAVGLTPELLPMIMSVTMGRGAIIMAKKGVIVKKLPSIPNLGSMTILCTDKTGTLTEGKIELVEYVDSFGKASEEVLRYAYLNSSFQTSIENPMDEAVLKHGCTYCGTEKKVDEIPFDFVRKKMSVVVENPVDGYFMITKGAPEEVLKGCTHILQEGKEVLLTEEAQKRTLEQYAQLSTQGYRVVAIAKKNVEHQARYRTDDEVGMVLLGYIAFLDPAKKDVEEVVSALRARGVAMKIITGDNELVTEKICRDLSFPVSGVLLGGQIHGLTDDALEVAVLKNTIFARFSPDEKNRVIRALQASGAVVGYMGDGINDAPSLRTADIGISVSNAVDVAKASADIILTQKSLKVLLDGIEEGRRTFANSMKYIMMGISSNFGNMFSVLGAVLFLPFLPMLPIHILLNNLLYDASQMMLPEDYVDEEETSSPRRWDMHFVRSFMYVFGFISSIFDFLTFGVLYYVFQATPIMFQTGWFIESLATQTLIIHVIRTKKIPFIQSMPHPLLLASTFGIVIFGWLIPYTPLGAFFKLAPLPVPILLSIVGIVLLYLVTVEVGKRIFYKYYISK